jgi:hypothetical protein
VYFIIVFLICWLIFWIKADKSRAKELYGAVIYTSFLGLLTDLIMIHYKLWSYNGMPQAIISIPLTLDFGIYPVVAYLYTQTLPETWGKIARNALFWTLPAITFEYITLHVGSMKHHLWWNLWLSFIADILIYLSIAVVYRFYRPAYRVEETR